MARSNIAFGNWIERNKVRRGVFAQIFMTLLAIALHPVVKFVQAITFLLAELPAG